uniref:Uncharacterized protein MANES_18G141200 n=1 Tax=Rhizophora mucronata TaxID=61149 RepID=A0A2P2K4J0_RHIMU
MVADALRSRLDVRNFNPNLTLLPTLIRE